MGLFGTSKKPVEDDGLWHDREVRAAVHAMGAVGGSRHIIRCCAGGMADFFPVLLTCATTGRGAPVLGAGADARASPCDPRA